MVLLILFLLFVGLALALVGFANRQINAQFEQQLTANRRFLQVFFTDDEALLDSLAAIPVVLLVVFKLTLRFLPLFIALMGFDQLAGELGPKSIRYLVVRVRRSSIILGKLLSQATLFAVLMSICTILMVLVAKAINTDFAAPQVALWIFKLIASSMMFSLAYLALTSLFSALSKQGAISLVLNVIALFVIWFIAVIGELARFPGEAVANNSLAALKPESALAYLRYASVWHFGEDLLHPHWSRFLTAALIHVGFGLVFLGLAHLALKRKDL